MLKLRPYQLDCIEKCLSLLASGVRRQIVSLPVGSGKTVVFTNLIKRVLAHREELIFQAYNTLRKSAPELLVGIDQAGKNADVHGCDVIVAGVNTLGRQGTTRLLKYDPSQFKCIIIDEAHHAAAESYLRIVEHFKVASPESHLLLWGCSATVQRHDRKMLGSIFDQVAYHQTVHDMIQENWLCKVKVVSVNTNIDISNVRKSKGDFQIGELSNAVDSPERNALIVSEWKRLSAKSSLSSTLVFAVDIRHVTSLRDAFREAGVHAEMLTGKTSSLDRREILRDFSSGQIPVLVNCGILTEGTDIPRIDCLVMARPTSSETLFQQMVGRGMRRFAGKEECVLMDFVDISSKTSMVIHPSLDGIDPFAIRPKPHPESEKEDHVNDSKGEANIPSVEETITDVLRRTWDLFEPRDKQYRLSSLNAWIKSTNERYLLNLLNGSILEICKAETTDGFAVIKRSKLPNHVLIKTPLKLTAHDLETAVKAADTYVKARVSCSRRLFRNAPWRGEKASEQQLNLLKKLGVAKHVPDWRSKSSTKGQVNDLITLLMAKG